MTKSVFLVGGAVRDSLMGIEPKDRDFVVVGSSVEEMIAAGFKKVGADFPVFLHPETGEEYALARREVSTGSGYNDFSVEFGKDVTLEQDLCRRDLTINSIAQDIETGEYFDPFGGIEDIKNGKLRQTFRKSFEEDPVRVLRLARFAARWPGFVIDKETFNRASSASVEFATAERVGVETVKALSEVKPSRFFDVLRDIGQLKFWFPEVHALIGQSQPLRFHSEGDAYVHTMMVVDAAARAGEPVEHVFCALVHDFGKGLTPKELLPKHYGHEQAGVRPTLNMVERIKLNNTFKDMGIDAARYHTHVHNLFKMKPRTIVRAMVNIRHRANAVAVSKAAFFDNEGKLPYTPYGDNAKVFVEMFEAVWNTKLSGSYTPEEIQEMKIARRANEHENLRVAAVKKVLDGRV